MVCTPSEDTVFTKCFAKIAWFPDAPESNFLQSTEWKDYTF